MPNDNQLEKRIFVIHKTDQKSNYPNSQRAITNQNAIKNERRIWKEALLSVVCGEWKKTTYKYMEKYFKRKKSKQWENFHLWNGQNILDNLMWQEWGEKAFSFTTNRSINWWNVIVGSIFQHPSKSENKHTLHFIVRNLLYSNTGTHGQKDVNAIVFMPSLSEITK